MRTLFKVGKKENNKRRGVPGDWCCKIRIGPYDQKRARLYTDAGTSETWAALLQAAVDRKNAGDPPDSEAIKKLPRRLLESFELVSELSKKRKGTFADNVADYERELQTAGRDRTYVKNVKRGLEAVATACGWKKLADADRESLANYLAKRKTDGTAPRTINNELAALKTFFAWCIECKRIDANPCDNLKRAQLADDRRRQRRALTRDECSRLLAVAGVRELVYRVALGTGLRRRELKLLQWRDVSIDDPVRPCVRLRAEATKSRRADILPISRELAKRLCDHRATPCVATEPVFRLGRTRTIIPKFQTWCDDLQRAGIAYKGDDGSILGFHSLRVTYVTELQKAGLPPRTVMQLARHTDYQITDNSYTDMRLIDTFGAVRALPDYGPEAAEAVALRNGTDNMPVESKARGETQDQIEDQKTRPTTHFVAPQCSETDIGENSCQRNDTSSTRRIHRRNKGFLHVTSAKTKADDFGLCTGVLGLEPRTF